MFYYEHVGPLNYRHVRLLYYQLVRMSCCQYVIVSITNKYDYFITTYLRILSTFQINLTVVHLFMGVTINSAVIPITLCMFWERLTGLGMIIGSIGGSVLALISWLSVSATYDGGLNNFGLNASE